MKLAFFTFCSLLLAAFGCKTSTNDKMPIADKETLVAVLNSDSVKIIDVRTIEEFESGHISRSINYTIESLKDSMPKLNRSEKIITVCRSGNRSGKAAKLLQEEGFTDVYNGGKWQDVEELIK